MKNIKIMYLSADIGYREDINTYAEGYKNLTVYGEGMTKRANGAFPIFIKLMYALKAADPTHIDLDSTTLEDIDLLLPGVKSIVGQVSGGYLPSVPDYETLTAEWTI